jgi:hypothetical protein
MQRSHLFLLDAGHYEYSAVTTNKPISAVALWHFMAGREAQEKTLAELKDGFAFNSVPTNCHSTRGALHLSQAAPSSCGSSTICL